MNSKKDVRLLFCHMTGSVKLFLENRYVCLKTLKSIAHRRVMTDWGMSISLVEKEDGDFWFFAEDDILKIGQGECLNQNVIWYLDGRIPKIPLNKEIRFSPVV